MKKVNTIFKRNFLLSLGLLPVLMLLSVSLQAQFTTVAGSATNTAGNALIPSAGTGGCTNAPQAAGGTIFNLTSPGFAAGAAVHSVSLNLTHTWNNDLDIYLVSPSGEIFRLSTDNGGSGDNMTISFCNDIPGANYPTLPTTATSIVGVFNPQGGLVGSACGTSPTPTVATLDALTATTAGTWQLVIYDDAGGDSGTLLNWGITFKDSASPACATIGGQASGTVLAPATVGVCPGGNTLPGFVLPATGGCTGTAFSYQVNAGTPIPAVAGSTVTLSGLTIPGANTISYRIDPCVAVVTQVLNVQSSDLTAPVITAPAGITLNLPSGGCSTPATVPAITVTDNCYSPTPVVGYVVVNEVFGSQPAGWTSSSTGGADPGGLFDFGATATPSTPTNPAFVGAFALIDDDAAGSGFQPAVSTITSATYNVSSFTNLVLSFDWVNQDFAGSGEMAAELSFDGGATWTLLPGFPVTADGFGSVNFPIPDAMATSQLVFRFSYDDENDWAWAAAIDNFRIVGDGPPTPAPLVTWTSNVSSGTGLVASGTFPIGSTVVTYTATDVAGNTATASTTVVVNGPVGALTALICNDLVEVSLDATCSLRLSAEQILEGGPYNCYNNYTVQFDKTTPYGNGPWTSGPNSSLLTGADVNNTYGVRIIDPVTGNSCWGLVKIEDKLPPVLSCTSSSFACNFPDLSPEFSTTAPTLFKVAAADVPQTLQDAGPGYTFTLPQGIVGTIVDVDVVLRVDNDGGGFALFDTEASVTSPAGTTVDIWGGSVNGCGTDPLWARFDDEGATDLTCVGLTTGLNHNIPFGFGVLSDFDGEAASGNWTVYVGDAFGQDIHIASQVEIYFTIQGNVGVGFPNALVFGSNLNNAGTQVVKTGTRTYTVKAGTGTPVLDACSNVTLTYTDNRAPQACSTGLTAITTRRWTATDASGNTATCSQTISQFRTALSDIIWPPNFDGLDQPAIECSATTPTTAEALTPAIITTLTGTQAGPTALGSADLCELGVAKVDITIPVCTGTFKVLRKWTIIDWCTSQTIEHNQIIKVLDSTAPVFVCPTDLTVSTNQDACCSTFNMPDAVVTDNCSHAVSSSASAFIETLEGFGAAQTVTNTYTVAGSTTPGVNAWELRDDVIFAGSPCLPIGRHRVTYSVADACGNVAACSYIVTVQDLTLPSPICLEVTQVSIGSGDGISCGTGNIEVPASSFDNGSYDNCAPVRFKVRRMDSNTCDPNTSFDDEVRFCCADVDRNITVILRVYDITVANGPVALTAGEGHFNDCMIQVLVEDKLKPVCTPPAHVTVSCETYDPSFWAYGVATSYDNCCCVDEDATAAGVNPAALANDVSGWDATCNRGTIIRKWRATDCHGNTGLQCTQRIVVTYNQNYSIKWPNDVDVTTCNGSAPFGEPSITGKDCELTAVSYNDQEFTLVTDACRKIERTWTVINWCSYDANLACTQVNNPSTSTSGPTTTVAGNAVLNCWKYKQIIKINDNVAPTATTQDVDPCDYSDNDAQLWNNSTLWDAAHSSHDLCEGGSDVSVVVSDDCTTNSADLFVRALLFMDLNNDGVMETVWNSADANPAPRGSIWVNNAGNANFAGTTSMVFDTRTANKYGLAVQTTTTADNKKQVWLRFANDQGFSPVQLPYGNYKIKWISSDGCGNESVIEKTFMIMDCKKPTVVCRVGLGVNLMNNPAMQGVAVWATDFLQYGLDNCTPADQLVYGIVRSENSTGTFPTTTSVVFNCGDGVELVQLWAKDKKGNADFCEATIVVQDNMNVCPTPGFARVSGASMVDFAVPTSGVEDVQFTVSGTASPVAPLMSDVAGAYNFVNSIPVNSNVTVTPLKDTDPLNGVTTYDLLLISKHILGVELLNSPYKMIAADANKSGSITTFDIVELRKLILGITNELPNNTSWRFVNKTQVLNSTNPFVEPIQEIAQFSNITGVNTADFKAVKVGDVNGTAIANNLVSSEERTAGTLLFDVNDRSVKAGETFTVDFKASESVLGYQFTMNFENLEVVELVPGEKMTTGNFAVFNAEGSLTTSYDGDVQGNFGVTFRAKADGQLSQMLNVSSKITKAEAYSKEVTRQEVAFRFNGTTGSVVTGLGFEVYQNTPNPFINKTMVGFYLPEATEATLTVYDETGRTLLVKKGDFAKGANAITIDRALLNVSGVMYYKVATATHSATRKMIQTK